MRKITKQAVESFTYGETFKSANTKVTFENGISKMFLHDNLIAVMDDSRNIEVSLAGWNTKVTRERLNGIPGFSIYTSQGQAYLNGNPIEDDKFYTI